VLLIIKLMETRIARQSTIGSIAGWSGAKEAASGLHHITKWEKKWVPVGHLKLFKWVPVKRKVSSQVDTASRDFNTNTASSNNSLGVRDNATNNAREKGLKAQSRPFNDNAPITRSITNSNKMMKGALIVGTQGDEKGVHHDQQKETKHVEEVEAIHNNTAEVSPQQTPPYTPTTKVLPTSPSYVDEEEEGSNSSDNGEEEDEIDQNSLPNFKRWKPDDGR